MTIEHATNDEYPHLEIRERCLRDTRGDQLWEAYAEHRGARGPTVQSHSRKSVRTLARTAFAQGIKVGSPTKESGRVEEGWFAPAGSKRFHYFVGDDLRALCGKWMLWAHPADAGMDWGMGQGYGASGDCAECTRRLAKREDRPE